MSALQTGEVDAGAAASVEGALAAMEARLERLTALLEEQELRRRDLEEVVSDVMPAVNGMLRLASAKLDALEKSGALGLLPVAHRGLQALRSPERLEPMRPLALLRALRDPDVGRGIALLVELLRAAGTAVRAVNDNAPAVAPSPERRDA